MSLDIQIAAQIGSFTLKAEFVSQGGVTALFGRSGAGKTSLAQAIAGFIRPQSGHIQLDGHQLFNARSRVNSPVWRRKIGYVFQDPRLFPHMSVRANLVYGCDAAPQAVLLDQNISTLGLEALLDRRPEGLSGGEARRVAIGRALLSSPRLLILDEPLAGLDGARRSGLLNCLEQLKTLSGPQILYISHSVDEVVRLADQVVLMAGGRTLTTGPTEQIFDHPEAESAAGLTAPLSIVCGKVISHNNGATQLALGASSAQSPPGQIFVVPRLDMATGNMARIAIDARDIALSLSDPTDSSVQNRLPVTISAIRPLLDGTCIIELTATGYGLKALITRQAVEHLDLKVGTSVMALIKAVARAN